MRRVVLAAAIGLAAPLTALAQDFGLEWLDRVTHEREPAQWPMSVRPVALGLEAGALYEYDTNIFLESTQEKASSIIIPFVRGRIDYSAPRWDAAADVLVDYKRFLEQSQESGFDERGYGRLRYNGPRATLEATEIFLHETDPTDAQFSRRAERYVSTTTGHGGLQVLPDFSLEADATLTLVDFRDRVLDDSDNVTWRGDISGVWRAGPSLDLLAQGGLVEIHYLERDVPDADGWFARGGIRGDLVEKLSVTALGGLTEIRTGVLPTTRERKDFQTADVSINVRYEALAQVVLLADYTRQAAFGGPGDPYEMIDRWVALAEWQATSEVVVRGRTQLDRVHSVEGSRRTYLAVGGTATYAVSSHFNVDLGVTWRRGDLDIRGEGVFEDVIGHIGVVLSR